MKHIKKYNQFITEALSDDLKNKLSDKFKDLKEELLDLVSKSLNDTEDISRIAEFLEDYSKEDSKTNITGLINDADVYSFYIKYTNDIDQILEQENLLEKSPTDQESFSLYDYVVKQTKSAIKIVAKELISDLANQETNNTNENIMSALFSKKDPLKGKIVIVKNGKYTFVYQLLDKDKNSNPLTGSVYNAMLIGDFDERGRFILWDNIVRNTDGKRIQKKFIKEKLTNWIEPSEERKQKIKAILDKFDLKQKTGIDIKL